MHGVVAACHDGGDEAIVASRDGLGVGEATQFGVAALMVSTTTSLSDSRRDGLRPLKVLTRQPSVDEDGMVD